MKVLMFGWEFPPHIAGGLGTACYGIVKGLAYNGVETIFVMPSAISLIIVNSVMEIPLSLRT